MLTFFCSFHLLLFRAAASFPLRVRLRQHSQQPGRADHFTQEFATFTMLFSAAKSAKPASLQQMGATNARALGQSPPAS